MIQIYIASLSAFKLDAITNETNIANTRWRWKPRLSRYTYTIERHPWQGAGQGVTDVMFGNIRRRSTCPISPERVNVWGEDIEKSNGRCGVAVLLFNDDEAEKSSLIAEYHTILSPPHKSRSYIFNLFSYPHRCIHRIIVSIYRGAAARAVLRWLSLPKTNGRGRGRERERERERKIDNADWIRVLSASTETIAGMVATATVTILYRETRS
jgi:hypothetical protein